MAATEASHKNKDKVFPVCEITVRLCVVDLEQHDRENGSLRLYTKDDVDDNYCSKGTCNYYAIDMKTAASSTPCR